jgi:hypothetical protein
MFRGKIEGPIIRNKQIKGALLHGVESTDGVFIRSMARQPRFSKARANQTAEQPRLRGAAKTAYSERLTDSPVGALRAVLDGYAKTRESVTNAVSDLKLAGGSQFSPDIHQQLDEGASIGRLRSIV